jgi:hypothetical protein
MPCRNIQRLPVKRLRQPTQIMYRSPAPAILAAGDQELQQAIAVAFCQQFRTLSTDFKPTDEYLLLLQHAVSGITVSRTLQGDLEFALQDRAITNWLNYLLHPSFTLSAIAPPQFPNLARRTFSLQHAHARCCSLLQQATIQDSERSLKQSLVAQDRQPDNASSWCWSVVRLQGLPPSENVLVHRLLALLDGWVDGGGDRAKQCFGLAEDVATAFDQVDRDCQLFSPAIQQNRDRRQTYLLVLQTTRQVLCQCLHGFGFRAPTAL